MIKEEHVDYIITKLAEMCNEESKNTCSITDTYFLVPNGELVLRRCDHVRINICFIILIYINFFLHVHVYITHVLH